MKTNKVEIHLRRCVTCKVRKDLHLHSRKKSSLAERVYYICRACNRSRVQAARKKAPKKWQAYMRKWRRANKEAVKGYHRKYYLKNRKRILAAQKAHKSLAKKSHARN